MLRTATVKGDPRIIAAYLPDNYAIVSERDSDTVVIAGHDRAGWTLDGYVIPRLASGLYFAREVPPAR